MYVMTSEARIDATPEVVYGVLTDLAAYAEWNPWNVAARGEPRVGGPLVDVDVVLGRKRLTVQHKILVMAPGQVFQWCDTGWFTAFVYGQRTRYIEPGPDGGARYRVELMMCGLLTWLARLLYEKHLRSGLDAETAALKARAESVPGS